MDNGQPPSIQEEVNQGRLNTLWFLDEFNLFANGNFAEALSGIAAKGRTGGNKLVLPQ